MKRLLIDIDRSCYLIALFSIIHAIPIDHIQDLTGLESAKAGFSNSTELENVCVHENGIYTEGQHFTTSNPCETCVCDPPGFSCSLSSCDLKPGCKAIHKANQCCPEYVCECERNGKIYGNGEKVEEPNPCKVCYCKGGEIKCALVTCYTRDDCEPGYVAGVCCPKYDHCPPLEMMKNKSTTPTPALVIISDLKTESEMAAKHRDLRKPHPQQHTIREYSSESTPSLELTSEQTSSSTESSTANTESSSTEDPNSLITTTTQETTTYETTEESTTFESTTEYRKESRNRKRSEVIAEEETTTDLTTTEASTGSTLPEDDSNSTTIGFNDYSDTTEEVQTTDYAENVQETVLTPEYVSLTTETEYMNATEMENSTEYYNSTESETESYVLTEVSVMENVTDEVSNSKPETVTEDQSFAENSSEESIAETGGVRESIIAVAETRSNDDKSNVIRVIVPKAMKKDVADQVQRNSDGPAPIVVMISAEQIQFLKLAEEPPMYVENRDTEDRKKEHDHLGVIVVPKTTPTTVEMVKVVAGRVNTTADDSGRSSSNSTGIIQER